MTRHTTSAGRAGWSVELGEDPVNGARRQSAWTEADPLAASADAVVVARKLWESWPGDSIVDDRAHGVFVESERIVHIDHEGAYSVSGPLNVPEPPQRKPVVLWRARNNGEADLARRLADIVAVRDEQQVRRIRSTIDPGAIQDQILLVEATTDSVAQDTQADGFLLVGSPWASLVAVAARLRSEILDAGTTLRSRVGLADGAAALKGNERSAFPVTSSVHPAGATT